MKKPSHGRPDLLLSPRDLPASCLRTADRTKIISHVFVFVVFLYNGNSLSFNIFILSPVSVLIFPVICLNLPNVRDFSLLKNFQAVSGTHLAFYSMVIVLGLII
jgi:hypothetical protein